MRRNTVFGKLVTAVFLAGFLFGIFSARAFSWNPADDTNVNSRYTVESVEIKGASEARLSKSLRDDLQRHIGQRFSPESFARLSARVRDELRARLVSPKLLKGNNPDSVRVVLDVLGRRVNVSTDHSRLAWHTTQGWTGELRLTVDQPGRQALSLAGFSDGDTSTERASGARVTYAKSLLPNRLRAGFLAATHNASYSSRTLDLAQPNDLYRHADTFHPTATFLPFRLDDRDELALDVGMRWQRFRLLSPDANRDVSSHALVNTLRYRRVRGDVDSGLATFTASASLTRGLADNFQFTRRVAAAGLEYHRDASRLTVDAVAGSLSGRAPFTERFAAGNTQLLRGWNKFEIAPLGASRLLATNLEYGHALKGKLELSAFYDSGAIWSQSTAATPRHSAGCGLRTRDGFFFYLAFPLRDGRVEPTLMTGATF